VFNAVETPPGDAVQSILSRSTVLQFTGGGAGEFEGVVEFAVGQQSGIAGDLGAEESEPETAVELGAKGLSLGVTHKDCPSFRWGAVRNPGITGVQAQLSC
jgi:hypothetical protein